MFIYIMFFIQVNGVLRTTTESANVLPGSSLKALDKISGLAKLYRDALHLYQHNQVFTLKY